MQLVRDYGVLDQQVKRNNFERVLVGSFEHHGTGCTRTLHLQPAGRADAPTVPWLEAGKAILRHRGREVVAQCLGGLQERLVDDAADGVDAQVVRPCLTASCAIKAGHGSAAASSKRLAENVVAAGVEFGRQGSFIGSHTGLRGLLLAILWIESAIPAIALILRSTIRTVCDFLRRDPSVSCRRRHQMCADEHA